MRRGIRIIHTADSHIGALLPERPRLRRPRRGEDFIRSYVKVLERAQSCGAALVLHCGDVFDSPAPGSAAVAAAAAPLLELAAKGVKVVIVPGNHERSAIPSSLLLAHENIHIITEPTTLPFCFAGTRVAVSALPCIRHRSAERFAASLDATGRQRAAADVRLLAVHQTFESSRCGPAGYFFRSDENVVERREIPAEFAYVAAGHIHRHQVLETPHDGGPAIVYAGSPDRITFAERDEPKGCVMIEIDESGPRHRFLEHDVRPMQVVPIDVTGLDRRRIGDTVQAALDGLAPGAVAVLRLSGRTTAGRMRGLGLSGLCRQVRPDALVSVSARAVEFSSDRDRPAAGAGRSALSRLRASSDGPVVADATDLRSLPPRGGVYALYDAAGRLLYIGKAANVRARVRSHVRSRRAAAHFDGWTRQIAKVETLAVDSDLEAVLLEAWLIGRLRPPFNRQMRRWMDYCYICRRAKDFAQLEVSMTAQGGEACYGPYRSRFQAEAVIEAVAETFGTALCPRPQDRRTSSLLLPVAVGAVLCDRFYQSRCTGPCAARVTTTEYAGRVAQRDSLLAGHDDSVVVACEAEVAELAAQPGDDERHRTLKRRADTLRWAFDHAVTLNLAEKLVNGILILPGPGSWRKVITLTASRIEFHPLLKDRRSAEAILRRHQRITPPAGGGPQRLGKPIVDAMSLAAKHLGRSDTNCHFVPAEQVRAVVLAAGSD